MSLRRPVSHVALVVGVVAWTACARHDAAVVQAFHPLDVGMAAPAYAAATLGHDTVRLGGPGPPTVLNVWATWCFSCAEEMSELDSLQGEFGARGLRVIGVSVDEGNGERVQRFAQANHLHFTIAHDPSADIERQYRVVGVPTTFVIGRDGRLVWMHTGNIVDVAADVRRAIASAVDTSAAHAPPR